METQAWQIPALIWLVGMIVGYCWMYVDSARCDGVDLLEYTQEQFDFGLTEVFLIIFIWPVLLLMMLYRFSVTLYTCRKTLILFQDSYD